MSVKPPIVFLAFANDRVDDTAYLRNLPKELAGIRKALQPAVQAGLCEVVERANITIHQILDVFQDVNFRDRVAVFHYGGHANGYQLLLENLDGSHSSAHSEGLVSFLAKQRGIKLVFLNGCSSQKQATDLAQAGIPAVVGTSQSINDDVATALAVRFYSSLGQGGNLLRAWTESIDEAKLQHGTGNMRDLFWEGGESEVVADHFPWEIYYREGEELVKSWNLPESVDNPLFGLPEPIAQYDLPAKPYRFLERYSRDHATIFFGRSYYIRDLFNQAMDVYSPPVILFYGQSGVGKSSMLDAGAFPRLERVAQVVYMRRNQDIGLEGTLRQSLGLDVASAKVRQQDAAFTILQEQKNQLEWMVAQSESSLKSKLEEALAEIAASMQAKSVTRNANIEELRHEGANLRDLWMSIEEQEGKPLMVLLDQAEECFTRPNSDIKNELEDFLEAVREIFVNPTQRPKGKLILSYRKEYHPEIKEACSILAIANSEIFLKALSRKDIVEVITGLTRRERLKKQYHLTIEDSLPLIIADDLLEDRESPIAPILQILLTKMWNMEEQKPTRVFSVQLYQDLKKQGILMGDFFKEQMGQLALLFPEWVASGLALDALHQHTTKLGTAGTQGLESLMNRYADRQEAIEKLLEQFKSLYLLTDAGTNRTGLAHDTLAPLVVDEYRHSDKAGQRASIILENKVIAFAQDPETIIDADDLKIVEAGKNGMRLWSEKEAELIGLSQAKRNRAVAAARRARRVALFSMILIVMGFGVALFMYFSANEAKREAEQNAVLAQKEKEEAIKQTELAEKATKKALSEEEKATLSKIEADSARVSAEKSAIAAEEQRVVAVQQTSLAEMAKQDALNYARAADSARTAALKANDIAIKETENAKKQEKIAQYELLLSNAREVAIKSTLLQNKDTLKALLAITAYNLEHRAKKNNDDRSHESSNTHEIYEALGQAMERFANDSILAGESWAIDVMGKNILLSEAKGRALLGELQPQLSKGYPNIRYMGNYANLPIDSRIYATQFTGEKTVALGFGDGRVMLADQGMVKPLYDHTGQGLLTFEYLPQKKWLISSAHHGAVQVWSFDLQSVIATLQVPMPVNAFCADKNEAWVIGASESGQLLKWDMEKKANAYQEIFKHKHPLRSVAYSEEKNLIVAGCTQGEVLFIDALNTKNYKIATSKHKGAVQTLDISEGGRVVASASLDGNIYTWKINKINAIEDMAILVPAQIHNNLRIFSMRFDGSGTYLLFSDQKALRVRIMDPNELYARLTRMMGKATMSAQDWKIYVGEDISRE